MPPAEAQHRVQCGFLLDVVVAQRATVLNRSCENETLLIGRDAQALGKLSRRCRRIVHQHLDICMYMFILLRSISIHKQKQMYNRYS